MSEDPFVVIFTLAPVFAIISVIAFKIISMKRLAPLRPLFIVLLAPGIIAHEISHYAMCKALKVRVEKVQLLWVDKHLNIGGSVTPEPIQDSFFKPLLIALAPPLINTTLVCLLIVISPTSTIQWVNIVLCWFVASLVLCCAPSGRDLSNAISPVLKCPRITLKELGFLFAGVLTGLVMYRVCLLVTGVDLPPFIVAAFSLLIIALICNVDKQR